MRSKPVILVVDDDLQIISLMRSLLKQFGFEPLTASNGAQALATARESHPDLILLDKNMPGMTCAELIGGIRSIDGTARVPIMPWSGRRFRRSAQTGPCRNRSTSRS
jgi:two-component system, OmpR family, KDP operon response regulator KdpE